MPVRSMGTVTSAVFALFVACGCSAGCGASIEESPSDPREVEAPAAAATPCGGLAPPGVSARCSACGGRADCQPNGCYNGYFCNISTLKCLAPPAACIDAGGGGGSSEDGQPTRQACTGNFGDQLAARFGRLDGYVVSVVPRSGSRTCNGDSGHVHLQIAMKNKVYDVAINTDALQMQTNVGLPGGAWSEGWRDASLDYAQLGIHSGSFSEASASAAAQKIESFVASANHITVFATGYNTSGVHLVHRRGSRATDGAIVVEPTSANPRALLFRFSNQSF